MHHIPGLALLCRGTAQGSVVESHRARAALNFALGVACLPLASLASSPPGMVVAVTKFEGKGTDPYKGASLSTLLIGDLLTAGEPCKLRLTEWTRRDEVLKEIEFGQSRYADKATAPRPGQLLQPDVFVEGSVSTTATSMSWELQVRDASSGTVLAQDSGTGKTSDIVALSEGIGKRLASKLCKKTTGYRISGRMDEATVNGIVCGGLALPFSATSPEVAGSWKFTPVNENAGSFSYTAKNVGGATGSGSGTYKVIPGNGGNVRIQLAGKGSIHSPLGTFSAPITESLNLAPIPSCERVGDR